MTRSAEPIAIVGIGCRFPGGANGPRRFWQLLTEGFDAVTEVPDDRWSVQRYFDPTPGKPGKTYSRWGGFVDGIREFDAGFFGVSPREAARIDPQHRMLLETAWQALEDAGETLASPEARQTGVFVGISHIDYSLLQSTAEDQTTIDVYTPTGTAHSIAPNRISHFLDLTGPSVAFDTACSSSLTALHFACQSLWQGECRAALAGGANVLLTPTPFIGFSLAAMLSPDGRCHTFDERANGFVRGEGAGMVLLKPLSVAEADGDPIYALILGTAVNQDGGEAGLTVPDAAAQQRLVSAACRRAGVEPGELAYLEAHGTGTPVGDPIEIRALDAALSPGRPADRPCVVGSVKTNIGHLESAAGVAGLIKTALALRHGQVPPHLNYRQPNPDLELERRRLRICTELEEMPRHGDRRLAGVNSFGFGGANAHAILAEAPPASNAAEQSPAVTDRAHLLAISATSSAALRATAARWRDLAADPAGPTAADLCYTAGCRRRHHDRRLAVVGRSRDELARRLEERLAELGDDDSRPLRVGSSAGPVFVCSGQGPQWPGMGGDLFTEEEVFRGAIEQCDEALSCWADWSLIDELTAGPEASRLAETAIAQPAIFAIQVALARLLESWGVVPEAIVGHSVGEVAAAHLAGVLDLRSAAKVIYHRGRAMQEANAEGGMLAVGLPEAEAESLAASHAGVHLAAVNSPSAVTLAGELAELEKIAATLEQEGRFCRFVPVRYPFHTPAMEPAALALEEVLSDLEPADGKIAFFSTVTGAQVSGSALDAGYWADSVRRPVRFSAAVGELAAAGHELFLEIAPHPALSLSIRECLMAADHAGTVISSLRREERGQEMLLHSLAALYEAGVEPTWSRLEPEARHFRGPTYAWHTREHWHEAPGTRAHHEPHPHPVLRRMDTTEPRWQGNLDPRLLTHLEDHRVHGRMIFPAAGHVELALAAARELFGDGPCVLEDVQFESALWIPDDGPSPNVQLTYSPESGEFEIHTRPERGSDWTRRAQGRMRELTERAAPGPAPLAELRSRCDYQMALADHYSIRHRHGLEYGPDYQTVRELWRTHGAAVGRVAEPESAAAGAASYRISPAALDGAAQILSAGLQPPAEGQKVKLRLPARLRRLVWHDTPGSSFQVLSELLHDRPRSLEGNIQILDEQERLVVEIEGYYCQVGESTAPLESLAADELLYELSWQQSPLPDRPAPRRPADYMPSTDALARQIRRHTGRSTDPETLAQRDAMLQRVAEGQIWRVLLDLGWQPRSGDSFSVEELAARLAIDEDRHACLERSLACLAAGDRLTAASTDRWVVADASAVDDPADTWRSAFESHPAARPELTLLRRWAGSLAEILRGQRDGRSGLEEGQEETLSHLFGEGWRFRSHNRRLAEAALAAIDELPEGRRISILELGSHALPAILPRLPGGQIEYVSCHSSTSGRERAEQRFGGQAGLRFELFDLDRPPAERSLADGGFDLVLASRALTTASDPAGALAQLTPLLAPEGLLLLLEQVRPLPWMDLLFSGGASLGDSPRDLAGWQTLMSAATLSRIASVDDGESSDHALLLARGPGDGPAAPREAEPSHQPGSWVLLADGGGLALRLAAQLRRLGERCLVVHPGGSYRRIDSETFESRRDSIADYQRLVEEVGGEQVGWVHLGSLDSADMTAPDGTQDGEQDAFAQAEEHGCLSTLRLVQALIEQPAGAPGGLSLVTRGAQPAGRNPGLVQVAQASLIGLGRVISNELPQLACRRIDLSDQPTDVELAALADELIWGKEEPEVALRGEARYAQRLARGVTPASAAMGEAETAYRVELTRPGSLDNLRLAAAERQDVGPGEVEVEVAVAALNFRDVMKTLGIYPAAGADALLLGDECTGRVTALGPGVEGLSVGDEVMALGLGCLSSRMRLPAEQLLALPRGLDLEEAATLPIAFLTAWYALDHLAGLRRGERVLIHSATGGVGMAALQVARRAGAEIFATAGSEAKRELLRALGVEHVFDSRSLEFARQIQRLTDDVGVDVVLNSLTGQAIDKSLEVLRPFGRFLELGKRDIHQNRKLAMRLMKDNLAFFAIDLGQARQERPELVRSMLAELGPLFADGELRPLPARTYPATDVRSAFHTMARARHVGKLLVSFTEARPAALAPAPSTSRRELRADASYLVTGGLGGFGLEVARWLAERGARHLVLAGRRGAVTDGAKNGVQALRDRGVEVLVTHCDVSSPEQVDSLFERFEADLPPLAGIVHAAMVLDDATLANLTPDRFTRVTAPKARGAWNLHRRSLSHGLDFFVLFSSAAGVVGNPGQGSYAAANCFLDALAHHRQSLGLPALAVDWGVLGEVGVVAEHDGLQEVLARQGLKPLAPRRATATLGRLLSLGVPQATVMEVDWRRFADALPVAAASPRLEALVDSVPDDRSSAGGGARIRESLRQAPAEQRQEILESYLCSKIGRALGLEASEVSRREPLIYLVTDSLVGVELATSIQSDLKVSVPLAQLLAGRDVTWLAGDLLRTLENGRQAEPGREAPTAEPGISPPAATL